MKVEVMTVPLVRILVPILALASGLLPPTVSASNSTPFVVRNYGGKCLDFGAPPQVSGAPIFIYGCNGTIAQQVRVVEINDRHEVMFYVGSKVVGAKEQPIERTSFAPAVIPETEVPLELRDESRLAQFRARQIFALDGDSIILAAQRDFVVKVQGGRGANHTPLVLGHRNLTDAEFWNFEAFEWTDCIKKTCHLSYLESDI